MSDEVILGDDNGVVVDDPASLDGFGSDLDPGTLDPAPEISSDPLGGSEPADPLWLQLDYGGSLVLVDLDYSGAWDHAAIDLDDDGVPDVLASLRTNGVSLMFDTDGDGQFDHTELVSFEELADADPQLYAIIEQGLELTHPEDAEYVPANVDYEQVSADNPFWFEQAENGFCVPASVAQIVASYTGAPFQDEGAFVDLANDLGLWKVGYDGVPGMTMEGAMYLMEQAGVPASMVVSANLDMLESYLVSGHGVVLYVNSSEVWGETELGAGYADHALVLTEIDHDNGVAILSDPGHPEGDGFTVPIEVLEDAWADGNNTMVVAEQPVDAVLAETPMLDEPVQVAAQTADEGAPHPESEASGDGGFTPLVNGEPLEGIELHTPIPGAVQWLVQRPWVLLPVAIGASRLFAR